MESVEESKGPPKECVKVAVNVRPLITTELLMGCTDCVTIVPGEPQVQIGSHAFTFDHVYGSSASPYSSIFGECVLPLIDALFHGYNATVLAYGQTGSGKTYTMGTNYTGEGNCGGIIPQVMNTIFGKIDAVKDTTEFLVRVSFIEIFKEEVFDLLDQQSHAAIKSEGAPTAKPAAARAPIQIRETALGGITLAGVTEAEVRTKEEMASYLTHGSINRATGSTNMNSQSSRSHAIFTIHMEQKKINHVHDGLIRNEAASEDILFAKLHLVDLAGSERAKRTGADGLRLKEGIHINKGLLALGNVISALGDEKKRKEGGHVPYRDSKLTRLLQDSLGGNSKTVMIACISPADSNAEETINTLKYANRARNIQNKAMINRDPVAAEMQRMRSQLEQLQAELLFSRGEGASFDELQILREKISLLEASNTELRQELNECQITSERLRKNALDAQVEKDKLILKIDSIRSGKSWDEIDEGEQDKKVDVMKAYISKIQELEAELLWAQSNSNPSRNLMMEFPALDDMDSEEEHERVFSTAEDQLKMNELDKELEQKQAELKQYTKADTAILKHHFEKKVLELEHEKKLLMKEIEDLRSNLSNLSSNPDEGAQKLKADYLQKLNVLETQVSELKKKQEAQAQLLRQKQKSDEAAKKLQEEIQKIKSQKVQLQQKVKQESEHFRSFKASRDKEVLQLKKEGRRNLHEVHKLRVLNERQSRVVQRKTEEAALATKKLKELLAKKSPRDVSANGTASGPGILQALVRAIEHELEITLRVHEVRSEQARQLQERAALNEELARIKEESEMLRQKIISESPQTMSPSARNSRILALENMLDTTSSAVVAMASQLSEAEERVRAFSGKERWNQVRTVGDSKIILNYLFDVASSTSCKLHDKEVSCRQRDSEIAELKDKVVKLNISKRQLEQQLTLARNLNLLRLSTQINSNKSTENSGITVPRSKHGGQSDAVCQVPQNPPRRIRSSCQGASDIEDMDISDSEMSEVEASDHSESDCHDGDWVASRRKTRRIKINKNASSTAKDLNGCCTCSKSSYCKTKRCECRAQGGTCSLICGCVLTKCNNRQVGSNPETTESVGSHSSVDNLDDESRKLVTEGTILLQNALSKKSNEEETEVKPRKALSNIGNSLNNQKADKQSRRKKWRKSKIKIQLVPTEIPPSLPAQNNEAPMPREDVPLRLPRAMDSSATDDINPLADMNSSRAAESVNAANKGARRIVPPRSSPLRSRKPSDEKENQTR